jgi:hypothetical protein
LIPEGTHPENPLSIFRIIRSTTERRRRPQIRAGFWVWVLGVIKKRFVWMFDRNRVRGVVDEPKPFFFNEWEVSGPFPSFPDPPTPKLA